MLRIRGSAVHCKQMVQDWYLISPVVTQILLAALLLEAVKKALLEMKTSSRPWRKLGWCDLQKASGSDTVGVIQSRVARREVFGTGDVLHALEHWI